MKTTIGRFELRIDEETGRRYWWGFEDGWKDATEIGEDGVLTISAQFFAVGTVLVMSEPAPKEDKNIRAINPARPSLDNSVSPLTNCVGGIRICAVEGCQDRAYADHEYCTKHRLRFERTGDPTLARKRGRKARA